MPWLIGGVVLFGVAMWKLTASGRKSYEEKKAAAQAAKVAKK